MQKIRLGLFSILEADHPQTVRGAWYQTTVLGLLPKIEAANDTAGRLLGDMRKSGVVPLGMDCRQHPVDAETKYLLTMLMRSLEQSQRRSYRKAIWNDQNAYC